jgi:hypothetical protein
MERRQPEKVEFLPKDITVRANWDHDASYELGSNKLAPAAPEEESKESITKPSTNTGNNRNSNLNNNGFGNPGSQPGSRKPDKMPTINKR